MIGHPGKHRTLSRFHQIVADHNNRIAAWHEIKATDPMAEIPVPIEPHALALFRRGDYEGFARATGLQNE